MSAELQWTYRMADVSQKRDDARQFADRALRATARFWFVVAIGGQLLFAFTVAAFYGRTAARGDLQSWNRFMLHGHVAGDTVGNFAVALHLMSAVFVILAGAIQFVPQIRSRFPLVHRWSGRIYMLTAVTLSMAGLYMHWVRGAFGDTVQRLGGTLNAVLIFACAAMALRYAIARDFRTHRRWALRLFLVVNGAWFFRVGFFLTILLFQGPVGFDPNTFAGPFLTFMAFASFLFPLAVLELYFRAQDRPGAPRRLAMASALLILTVAMGAGILAVTSIVWLPNIKAAFDDRRSIAYTLSSTITTAGLEQAVKQYRALKAGAASVYNFDEVELNRLGYQLLRDDKLEDAIRIFQLNVETYPRSSNTWDSLAESYLRAGKKPEAIANYRKSLELNPNNRNAVFALQKLGARDVASAR